MYKENKMDKVSHLALLPLWKKRTQRNLFWTYRMIWHYCRVYELHIDPASCKFMYLYNMHIFDNGFTPNIVQNIILSFWNNIQYFTSTIQCTWTCIGKTPKLTEQWITLLNINNNFIFQSQSFVNKNNNHRIDIM